MPGTDIRLRVSTLTKSREAKRGHHKRPKGFLKNQAT
jgi:hypothetical protein